MTSTELVTRTLRRLDEDAAPGTYFTSEEALTALNIGQRLFVLLTLCLESTTDIPLSAGQPWLTMLELIPTWLMPLRIRNANGVKVAPARLQDLDALDESWMIREGEPTQYAALGFEHVAITPHPAGASAMSVTYARCPVLIEALGTPEIPEEYHACLIDAAIPIMRAKEGAQELQKALPYFDRFLVEASKMAEFIRGRNKAQRYDRQPFELSRFDKSKLVKLAIARPPKAALLEVKADA